MIQSLIYILNLYKSLDCIGVGAGASVGGPLGAIAAGIIGQSAKVSSRELTAKNAEFARALVRNGETPQQARETIIRMRDIVNVNPSITPDRLVMTATGANGTINSIRPVAASEPEGIR